MFLRFELPTEFHHANMPKKIIIDQIKTITVSTAHKLTSPKNPTYIIGVIKIQALTNRLKHQNFIIHNETNQNEHWCANIVNKFMIPNIQYLYHINPSTQEN